MSELERCCDCDDTTGKAGQSEDSLYTSNGVGPFCETCWNEGNAIERREDQIAELKSTAGRLRASVAELEAENAELKELVSKGQSVLDTLRAKGWSVAAHNDYKQSGNPHTFWLLTKGNRCYRGEGVTDWLALSNIATEIQFHEEALGE